MSIVFTKFRLCTLALSLTLFLPTSQLLTVYTLSSQFRSSSDTRISFYENEIIWAERSSFYRPSSMELIAI